MKRALFLVASGLCFFGFAYTQYLIFYVAPLQGLYDPDLSNPLFFNQKIFYYHVPCAFVLLIAVMICGVASFRYLRGRNPEQDDIAAACAELAVLFGAVMCVTGSIWAKAAWEKWWVWDLRLTTSLILWMTMVGYVLVRKYGGPGSERLGAGLAALASVAVPFVYFSVKIQRTLHPQTSVVPGLQGEQRTAFWSSVLLFIVFFVLLLRVRIDAIRSHRRVEIVREQGLDAGLFE